MKFSSLPLFTATAALWAAAAPLAAQAQTDPVDTVVGALSTLFQTGFSLQSAVSALNATNFPGSGPGVLTSLQSLSNSTAQYATAVSAIETPFPPGEVEGVVSGDFGIYVDVQSSLASTIGQKHDVVSQFPTFTPQFEAVLVSLAQNTDDFSHAVINLIPSDASEALSALSGVDSTFQAAVQVYSS